MSLIDKSRLLLFTGGTLPGSGASAGDLGALAVEVAGKADAADLVARVRYRGNFDASAGVFPGGGVAELGDQYRVGTAGVIAGRLYAVGDMLVAARDNASETVEAGHWVQMQSIWQSERTKLADLPTADDFAPVATSGSAADLSETELAKVMTLQERAKVARVNVLAEPNWRGAFHRSKEETAQALVLDEAGRIAGKYPMGSPFSEGWRGAFHRQRGDGDSLLLLNSEGAVLGRLSGVENDAPSPEPGIPEVLPSDETGGLAAEGNLWIDEGGIRRATPLGEYYTATIFSHRPAAVYGRYDALMAEHPDYITSEVIGVDASGFEIRAYTFTPPAKQVLYEYLPEDLKPPKIVVICGVHGSERAAQQALSIFVDHLCKDWRTREGYQSLRYGVELVVIPAAVPTSMEDSTRKSRAGVDINRNFATADWSTSGSSDPASQNYRGAAAGSELETQAIMTFLDEHRDAVAVLDLHGHTGTDYATWIGTSEARSLGLALELGDYLEAYAHRELLAPAQDQVSSVLLSASTSASLCSYVQEVIGLPAILLEFPGPANPFISGSIPNQRRYGETGLRKLLGLVHQRELRKRALSFPIIEE